MKNILSVFFISIIVILGLFVSGCGQGVEKFGDTISGSEPKTAIASILFNPQKYNDKDVVLDGKIVSECPTGGFIYVQDQSGGTIYVEMHSAPFAPIPQRTGRAVQVKGTVYLSGSASKETKLLGKGLVIK
ncbi:MAG: hypothetical protein Q7S30_04500 [Candidatus Omnitrophota bacterium]|nr:hypothetical protein [Candidatus Omnitrophota bacterium]